MNQDEELAARTRRQIERAQRAAEEARQRVRASRGGALRLSPEDERQGTAEPTRSEFPQYFSGD